MRNAAVGLAAAVLGLAAGYFIFRSPPAGTPADLAQKIEAQGEQIRQLSEAIKAQQENFQKMEGMFQGRSAHQEKLSPAERRKQSAQSYQFVMDLARKVVAEAPLAASEEKPFLNRVEIYAKAMAALYYDEANEALDNETRRRRAREMTDALNKDVQLLLSEINYKQYLLIVRKYQSMD